jgi:uncharacterized protein
MDPNRFMAGLTRETNIRRDANGRWFNEGEPLEHANLARAFDRWVALAEDGRYCLKNDINWAYFTLEGPPLFVRALRFDAQNEPRVRYSNDVEGLLDPASLRQGHDGALYCTARENGLCARFDAHAAQQLEQVLGEDETGVYLVLTGQRVRVPEVDDPLLNG